MAELAPRERLQPSLLDRLRDDRPEQAVESREQRVLSLRALREGVLRDLAWLLNSTAMALAGAPRHVANSVLGFGVPDLSGATVAQVDLVQLERGIRQAIWDFEPRLIRASVTVRALAPVDGEHHKLGFEIEADLWAQPYPEHLYLKSELDLERGVAALVETHGRTT